MLQLLEHLRLFDEALTLALVEFSILLFIKKMGFKICIF
jgi:hypothetical protein